MLIPKGTEGASCVSLLPLWCTTVPQNPECVFGKSLKMAVGTSGAGLFVGVGWGGLQRL